MDNTQTHALPDNPVYAFAPSYDFPDRHQRIIIVFEGIGGYVPTALIALSLDDAEQLCDRLNARLGLDREAWQRLVGRAMAPPAEDQTLH